MLSVLDAIFSLAVVVLALGVIGASLVRRSFRRYFFVNLSVIVMLLCDGLRYAVLYRYGFRSPEYLYTFILTDALLVTTTYLLILSFFELIFRNTPLRLHVRWALFFFILLVGAMSYSVISRSLPHFYSRLIVEFQQNMYFAAVILTVLLWISLSHLRVHDRQMALLIAGLGIFLSLEAASYAFHNLLPKEMFLGLSFLLRRVHHLAAMAKMGLWCYALASVAQQVPHRRPALVRAGAERAA